MGLGKTLQCISLIWTLLKQGKFGTPAIRRALVVTPSSLTKNWKKEFTKWLSPTRIDPYCVGDGFTKPKETIQSWKSAPVQRSVLIISYEQFRQNHKEVY
jgi:SNF2 family DNA or RNA helicase